MTEEEKAGTEPVKTREERKQARKEKKEKRKNRTPQERYGKFYFLYEFGQKVAANRFCKSRIAQAAALSLLLLLFIEGFEYKNPAGGFLFFAANPIAFFANWITIFATLTLAWLLKRRLFGYAVVSLFWIALGVTNGLVLMNRMTPFTTADMTILDMGFDILPTYLSSKQIVILVVALSLILLTFIALFFFGPRSKERPKYKRTLVGILISFLALVGSWQIGISTGGLATYFENLWDAYYDYGVPYGFINTWINTGVSKPSNYSATKVAAVFTEGELDDMSSAQGKTQADYPNIIFLQLESFIDPKEVTNLTFSEDPVPYYTSLKEEYSSGYLTVPVVGGGTANTEFEVMSGMSLRYFGPGEYPYKTVLKEETCETMAYDLKRLGYATHAIHNHRGAFYNRNTVFAHLGYDDFTSLEYMNYVSKTPKNFATDNVLTAEIFGAMESTDEKDYIYCISVQGHGKYPTTQVYTDPQVMVYGEDLTIEQTNGWNYYLEQIREMDQFLEQLTAELSEYEEDVVLVLYGDHLPVLDLENEQMKSGSTYMTQYVIWTNFDLPKEDKDLMAYQLSAEVQRRIDMREGTLTVFHQDKQEEASYLDNLHLLQYDMLYGKRFVYGGQTPFAPVDMKMGYDPIRIDEIIEIGNQYYIRGQGFTPYSKVSLDGTILDTIYMSPTVLKLLEDVSPQDASKMKVSQVEKYDAVLSTTE